MSRIQIKRGDGCPLVFLDPDPGGDQIRSLWSVSTLIRRKDFYQIKAEFQDEANWKTRDRRKINCEAGDRNR